RYWILSYLPILLFLAVFFIRFFIKLPNKTKVSFFIAGTVFIAGAVGVEILGDQYLKGVDVKFDTNYALFATVEELLEMLVSVCFARSSVSHISLYIAVPTLYTHPHFTSKHKSAALEAEHMVATDKDLKTA